MPLLASPPPTDQEQFLPYWTTEAGWESEIQLRNNQVGQPLTVTVVLRTPSGTETNLPSVTLKPHEAVVADVGTALRLVAPQLIGSWGSVALRYKASSEASLFSMAMIREVGKPIALHIDSTSIATNYQTGSREGIWWLPSDTTGDWLILSNEGNASLSLRLSLYDSSGRGFAQQVSLGPEATTRYSVRQLAAAGGLSGSYGGITVSADHNAGSLDTLHFLYDQTADFSALLKMYDHSPAVTLAQRDFAKTGVWTLRAPMLALADPDPALEFPAGTVLQPMLLVRNTSAAPVDANLSFEWKNGATTGNAIGPSLHLLPHQTEEVDIATLQNNYVIPVDANWAEVKLTTTANPGDVMAIASSYDKTLKYGAQTPFSDQLAFHWVGSVWEYDSTHDSIIAVGNGGTKPAEAAFTLTYNHGTGAYEIDQLLQPDQLMWIDVGQLIRNQIPDKNGVVLPAALSMGSYEIRQLNHTGPGTLFEGKVIYDKTYGSVTYGCATCCGYIPSQFEFFFDPLGIPIDGYEDQGVEGYDTCEGQFVDVTSDFYNSWSTVNQSIATVSAYGVHKGVAIGSTSTRASAREQVFNERQNCPIEPVSPTGPDNVSQVQITNVDLTNDEVDVTLQGPSSGTLTVTWNGPSGNPDIANTTESAGSYTFNPSLDTSNLATGQYTGVTATWQGASNTYSISFDVLGTYEHTQYNTPAESQCSGGSATAYLTPGPSACAWSTVSLIQQFITQAWENGSGITNNYGTCQEYLAGCSPPPGGNQNYFREVSAVEPSCGGSVSGTTVAVDRSSPGHPLDCGDQVLIVGLGGSPGTVKTVTDSCPACVGASHIDDFNTSNACSLTSLGNFQTIRINR